MLIVPVGYCVSARGTGKPWNSLLKLNGFILFPRMNNSPKNYNDPKADPLTTPRPTNLFLSLARSFAQGGPLGAAGGQGEGGLLNQPKLHRN